jgi:hypothetical protein
VCDVGEIVLTLDVSNGSSSDSGCEMFDAESNESVSETLVTHVSSNWLQVTDCDPEPNIYFSSKY